MAYGDCSEDEALRDAWQAFCDRLKEAGDRVFKDVNPATSIQRADGFRYLTRNLGQAFDLALETKDPAFPAFHRFCSPTRKLGSDCADAVYLQAWIDGASVYRVSGTRGTARFWNFSIQGPRPTSGSLHEPFGDTPEANLLGTDLETEPDGSFVLTIGGERRGRNWLPTTPGSRKIFFRQFFDRWDEEPAQCRIERIGMSSAPPPASHDDLIGAMKWAGNFVHDVVDYWPEFLWSGGALCDPEALNRFAGAIQRHASKPREPDPERDAGDLRRGRLVTQMRWRLLPDEALIVEFDDFEAFWLLTNEGIFGNSMDFAYRPVSYTASRTAVDEDGRVRLVMAHRDPGYANWIDTSGYEAGVLSFRVVLSLQLPELRTRVVKRRELADAMPAASPKLTPPERQRQLLERFHAIQRRFPL